MASKKEKWREYSFNKYPPRSSSTPAKTVDYTQYSDYRRYLFLNTIFIILIVACVVCAPINFQAGKHGIAIAQVVTAVIYLYLFYKVQQPRHLNFVRTTFIIIVIAMGLTFSGTPDLHPTVFELNVLLPIIAFFLVGKRWATIISVTYLPMATALFFWRHTPIFNYISLESLVNGAILMVTVIIVTIYNEITRADTENALMVQIKEHERVAKENRELIHKLEEALSEVKNLSGLLPICSSCKKIRDDKGYWNQIEEYIQKHSEAQFSHGMCPECAKRLYPDLDLSG